MAEYKCIKGFLVAESDDDGGLTDKDFKVKKGTIWHTPDNKNYRFIGGEIRLEHNDGEWIEIAKETFKEHFERVR